MFFIIKVYDIVYGGVVAEYHYQNKDNYLDEEIIIKYTLISTKIYA